MRPVSDFFVVEDGCLGFLHWVSTVGLVTLSASGLLKHMLFIPKGSLLVQKRTIWNEWHRFFCCNSAKGFGIVREKEIK